MLARSFTFVATHLNCILIGCLQKLGIFVAQSIKEFIVQVIEGVPFIF
jgi:hypothetical protein